MALSILDISRRAGDANIGQTMIRLARLAESAHRYQAATATMDLRREDLDQADGCGLGPVSSGGCTDAADARRQVHTEVNR